MRNSIRLPEAGRHIIRLTAIQEETNIELTEKLKEQVEQAKTKEEAKNLIAQAGMELTDEEMDQVAGVITF